MQFKSVNGPVHTLCRYESWIVSNIDVLIRDIFGDYYSLEENEASSEVPLQSWDNPNDVTLAGCLDAKCRWCHFENYSCLSFIISYIGV